jgi:hypothetical protein
MVRVDIFVSYRRDDTGGRAGRLADALAGRFGRRHVFQDVTAVAPGVSFDDQVDLAIAASDVVLVVIGRTWAGDTYSPDDQGGRRLDRPDDFVRHEVRAALRGDVVVVPVLVDGAELPSEPSLPDDLRPLVRRQAVRLRDESWHRDVEALIRQLTRGPDVEATGRRRRALIISGLAAIAAIAAVAIVLLALRDDDASSSNEPPSCEPLDDSWTTRTDLGEPMTAVDVEDGGNRLIVAPESASWAVDGADYLVQITVSVTNDTDPQPDTADDEVYVTYSDVTDLAVDRVQTDALQCVSVDGQQQLAPGRTVLVTLRFATTQDPADATIVVDLQDGTGVPIAGT